MAPSARYGTCPRGSEESYIESMDGHSRMGRCHYDFSSYDTANMAILTIY